MVLESVDVEKKDLLSEMRDSRDTANVAFINFIDSHKFFSSHVFCFFEGEDGKYYNQRIKNIIGNNIIPIISGNKRNTLKLWRKIKNEPTYNSVKKMFFVDKDVDSIPEDIDDNLYVTPCYSIENLYVNTFSLQSILESEFSINKTEPDFEKIELLFESMFKCFCDEMIEFNALVLLRNHKGLNCGRVIISNIKTSSLVSVKFNKIEKSKQYSATITNLKNQLQVEDGEVQQAIETIKKQGNYSDFFRGKNQLDFFVTFLKILRKENDNGNFFDYKRKTVTINLTNNRLSELSQYALTPKSLLDFLTNHKIT